MVRDAESHEEEDRRRREQVEARNAADSLVYSAEKMLADNAENIPDELKQEVEAKIQALKTALEGEDADAIKAATDELNEALQKVGQHVYSQQQAQAGAEGQAPGDDDTPDDTVEGEFREV